MFTGIVEEIGEIAAIDRADDDARLCVRAPTIARELRFGESVAVNGVCLTVVSSDDTTFTADVMPETLQRSTLAHLRVGERVNMERAVTPAGRLGGHLVQGHVDGVGTISSREPGPRWDVVRIAIAADLARYVVVKGSIAVEGVSLTVAAVDDDGFTVSLIPTTLAETTLGERRPGDKVNLEVDVIAKYVERLLAERPADGTRVETVEHPL
ncbi:MAG: riboflavin synthase [Frankiales bacterium]|nr:riboflavin synthase [Frankiales bacterium]